MQIDLKSITWLVILAVLAGALPDARGQSTRASAAAPCVREVTVSDLRRMYPQARLREVSPVEFAALTSVPGTSVIVAPAAAPPPMPAAPAPVITNQTRPAASSDLLSPALPAPAAHRNQVRHSAFAEISGGQSCVDVCNIVPNSGSGSELAVIVFVVVGTVVVAAAFVYAGYFVYEVLTGDFDGENLWFETGARASFFYGDARHGGMYGARCGVGFSSPSADVGLMTEAGFMHGDLAVRADDSPVSVSDWYGMLGPAIRWVLTDDVNPMMLELEVLAGMTGSRDLGLVSHAAAGLSFGIGDDWRLGASLGSVFIDIRETEGPVRTSSRFNLAGGLQLGRVF